MDKEIEFSPAHIKVFEQVGEALANFLSLAMRDLPPAAVAAMNQKLASGEGFYRVTTEAGATGMRCFAAFVAGENIIPILDIHIGNSDEELDSSEGTPWKVH